MKNSILLSLCLIIASFTLIAQNKAIKEADILGRWDLHIEVQNALEEVKKDNDIVNNLMIASLSGFVTELISNIKIQFDFQKNGVLHVYTDAFYNQEYDSTTWKIIKDKIYIENNKNFNSDVSNYWYLENGVLRSISGENINPHIYMIKIE
jgi:hypothetical protein